MNINDKMRAWRDTADGGGLPEVRRALYEVLDQLQHQLELAGPSAEQRASIDLTAKHYLDLCATMDMLKANVEAAEQTGRKTLPVVALKEILSA